MNKSLETNLALYDWDFVDSPPNEYFCGYCKEVFTRPMIIECCGGHFCASCIEMSYGNSYRCPDCQEEYIAAILDRKMWKRILELDVKCPFTGHGCLWTGDLRARGAHIAENCQYVDVICKYGCDKELEVSELAEHLEYFCPNRPVTCPHCGEKGRHEFINKEHKNECVEYPVNCPNNCEIRHVKRKDLEEHVLQCPLQTVECEYSYAGCNVEVKRKNTEEHNKNDIHLHMALIMRFFATRLQEKELLLQKIADEKDDQIQQLIEHYTQELKKRDEMIATLIKKKEKELEHKWQEKEKHFNKQLDEIVEEFESKYEELKLNISRINQLPEQFSLDIDSKQLEMISLLHRGKSNAEIWLGKYNGKRVAIKKPVSGSSPSEILQEAHTLKRLVHTNVLTVYDAITTGDPVCMILEYMPHGNLGDCLRNNPTLFLHEQLSVCKQVAWGLEYLQQKLCIHRRVRIDNVLVGENLSCKINDFSSAVFLKNHEEEYMAAKGFQTRVKWSAAEVLTQKRFCLKSDVWAFGILMWQVVTNGEEPYPGLTVDEAEKHISTGTHMKRPKDCSDKFYTLMLDCWKLDPQTRPTFEALADLLEHVKDSHGYTDVKSES